MIKTDKVVYRPRTQEEYDWLMEQLHEAGCKCNVSQIPPTKMDGWRDYGSETGLLVLKNVLVAKTTRSLKSLRTLRGSVEKVILSTIAIRTISLKNQGVKSDKGRFKENTDDRKIHRRKKNKAQRNQRTYVL